MAGHGGVCKPNYSEQAEAGGSLELRSVRQAWTRYPDPTRKKEGRKGGVKKTNKQTKPTNKTTPPKTSNDPSKMLAFSTV
jgi:hypothetical protein